MTLRALQGLACGLGLCLVGANVWVKPALDHRVVSQMSDRGRRLREWRGRTAPDFELPLLDGGSYRSREQAGQPVRILVFVTSWCQSCADALGDLQDYADFQLKRGRRIGVLAINGQETRADVRQLLANADVSLSMALDPSSDVTRRFEVTAFPTTVLIGADGRVRLYHEGALANVFVALDDVVRDEFARPPQT